MALKVGELYGELSLNSGPFTAGLAQAEGQTAASGLKMGAVMGVAMQAVQMALSDVGAAFGEARQAYLDNETSIAKLGQELINNVPNWDGNTKAIEAYAAAQADLGFKDDDVRDSLGKLVGVTHDVTEAMKLETLAEELARAKHLDLTTATKDVLLASTGVGRAMKGLGVDIAGLTGGVALLDALQKNVAGSAAAWAATNEGKLAVSQVKVHEDMVKFGALITLIAATVIPPLVAVLGTLADSVKYVTENLDTLGPVFVGVGTAASVALAPGIWAATLAFGAMMVAAAPILIPLAAIAAAVAVLTKLLSEHRLTAEETGPAIERVGKYVEGSTVAFNGFAPALAKSTAEFKNVSGAANTTGKDVSAFADNSLTAGQIAGNAYRAMATKAAESYVSVGGAAEAAGYKVGTAAFDSGTAATKAAGVIYTAMADIGTSFTNAADAAIAAVNAEITGAYDPQITAAELVVARLSLADDKKKLSAKGVTAEVQAQLKLQIINDQEHIDKLIVQQLTYGTKAQQIAKIQGYLTGAAHAAGLNSSNPQEQEAAQKVETTLRAVLAKLQGEAFTDGSKTGTSYTDGIASGIVNGKRVVVAAVNQLRGVVYAKSPPGPESPLHEIDKWGEGTGQAYMDKLAGALGNTSGIKSALAGLAPAFAGIGLQSVSAVAGQGSSYVGVAGHIGSGVGGAPGVGVTIGQISVAVNAGDGNLKTARRFGQEVADTIASTLREQMARTGGT